MNLTDMQKRYLWLAGSFPDRVLAGRQNREEWRLPAVRIGDDR